MRYFKVNNRQILKQIQGAGYLKVRDIELVEKKNNVMY